MNALRIGPSGAGSPRSFIMHCASGVTRSTDGCASWPISTGPTGIRLTRALSTLQDLRSTEALPDSGRLCTRRAGTARKKEGEW